MLKKRMPAAERQQAAPRGAGVVRMGAGDRHLAAVVAVGSGFPSNRGDFLIADSCNFAVCSDYRTPVQLCSSWCPGPGTAGLAGRAPGLGRPWACPLFLPPGAAEVSGVQGSPPGCRAQRDAQHPGGRRSAGAAACLAGTPSFVTGAGVVEPGVEVKLTAGSFLRSPCVTFWLRCLLAFHPRLDHAAHKGKP